jgi:hypothetical protein
MRSFSLSLTAAVLLALSSQSQVVAETTPEVLVDAPSSTLSASAPGLDLTLRQSSVSYTMPAHVSKYSVIVESGQSVDRLSGGEKMLYAVREQLSFYALTGTVASAGWSHLIDSAPHYGTNSTAFAQRVGASYARQTTQALATDGVFSALFHDDPRYYTLGRQHGIFARALYAATRVAVVRADDGHHRFNAPLMAGYATAAAVNNAYYPERDRGGRETAESFGSSLIGAAISFEVSEFLNDGLRIVHLKK